MRPDRPAFGLARENLTGDPRGREHAAAMLEGLAEATGVSLGLAAVEGYRELGEALEDGRVDFAWLPPVPAIRGVWLGHLAPIAVPVRRGRTDFHSVLIVRSRSGARSIAGLEGLRVAWVDRQSASGYSVPRARLAAAGAPPERLFRSAVFVGTHEGIVSAVRHGLVDVGATYAQLDDRGELLELAGRTAPNDLSVVLAAGPIPNEVIVASTRVPRAMIERVEEALVGRADGWPVRQSAARLFRCESLEPVGSAHLAALGELVAAPASPAAPPVAHP